MLVLPTTYARCSGRQALRRSRRRWIWGEALLWTKILLVEMDKHRRDTLKSEVKVSITFRRSKVCPRRSRQTAFPLWVSRTRNSLSKIKSKTSLMTQTNSYWPSQFPKRKELLAHPCLLRLKRQSNLELATSSPCSPKFSSPKSNCRVKRSSKKSERKSRPSLRKLKLPTWALPKTWSVTLRRPSSSCRIAWWNGSKGYWQPR